MDLGALITVGFLGLASGGFAGGAPISIGVGVGEPTAGNFNSPMTPPLLTEREGPTAPQGITFVKFSKKEFPFFTTVPDDGTGKAGGYQVAKVNLEFIHIVIPTSITKWYCSFTIQCRYGLNSWAKSTRRAPPNSAQGSPTQSHPA